MKEELKKNKRFNIMMFVIAIISLVVSLASLGVAFLEGAHMKSSLKYNNIKRTR